MIYIAAPFFNEEQVKVVEEIEHNLTSNGITYFSPREYGVIKDTPMTEDRFMRIYDMNIRMMDACDRMIAVIDDYDTGTIFEIGYMTARQKRVVSYSSQGHGLNVMLAKAIDFHCNNISDIFNAINNTRFFKDKDGKKVRIIE